MEICEHVEKPRRLVELAASMLAPSGRLVVTVPTFLIPSGGHLRAYGRDSMLELVEGLEVLETVLFRHHRSGEPRIHGCVCRRKF